MSFLKRVPFPVYVIFAGLEVVALACASVGYGDWPVLAGAGVVVGAALALMSTPRAK